nr:hypothetical protein [Nocardioides alcanivorans]
MLGIEADLGRRIDEAAQRGPGHGAERAVDDATLQALVHLRVGDGAGIHPQRLGLLLLHPALGSDAAAPESRLGGARLGAVGHVGAGAECREQQLDPVLLELAIRVLECRSHLEHDPVPLQHPVHRQLAAEVAEVIDRGGRRELVRRQRRHHRADVETSVGECRVDLVRGCRTVGVDEVEGDLAVGPLLDGGCVVLEPPPGRGSLGSGRLNHELHRVHVLERLDVLRLGGAVLDTHPTGVGLSGRAVGATGEHRQAEHADSGGESGADAGSDHGTTSVIRDDGNNPYQ